MSRTRKEKLRCSLVISLLILVGTVISVLFVWLPFLLIADGQILSGICAAVFDIYLFIVFLVYHLGLADE